MAVRYIVGRAGKGKTYQIFEEIKQKLQDYRGEKLILLVPEQYTLQAERDLLEHLQVPGIMKVEVLSIRRMGQRILNEAGGRTRTLINEQGRNMILKRLIDENSAALKIYGRASKQPGFVQNIADLISELKQQDIDPGMLSDKSQLLEEDSTMGQKLHDISTVYNAFNQYMEGRYLDMEDYLNLLIEKLQISQWLKGARVWIDSFTTFSSQSLRVIEQMMLQAEEVTISLTMDLNKMGRDQELFDLSRYTYKKLQDIEARCNLHHQEIKIDGKAAGKSKHEPLLHLESELYAYPYHVWPEKGHEIQLFAAKNIYSEVEQLAAEIIRLCREEDYRYREIAVVCNDLSSYGRLIKRAFHNYSIPFFMDEKREIIDNPVVEVIRTALEISRGRYLYEDVFRYVKTGLAGLETGECEQLENYVLAFGIKGKAWKQEFTRGQRENLLQLNHWREKVAIPLQGLEEAVRGKKTCQEITVALMNFMEEIELPQKIEDRIFMLGEENLFDLQAETRQIWGIIQGILQQMAELLGEQFISLKDYLQVLETGIESFELGVIPTTVDQVLVGSIQRSKSHDIKAFFVIGVNDGVLPSGNDHEGILSHEERDWLKTQGLEIGLSRELKAVEENFLIYSAFSKPSRYLRLSYALSDAESRALRPSLLIERFKQLFPQLKIEDDLLTDLEMETRMICTPASTYKYMVENLRQALDGKEIDPIWWDVYSWYRDQEQWQDMNQIFQEGLFHKNQPGSIAREKARQLYKYPLRTSVSRLEQYAGCPFAHFMRYGLRPEERKLYQVQAPDIGEVFHNTLQGFSRELARENLEWRNLDRGKCDEIIARVIDEILLQHSEGLFASSSRYKHLCQRLKRISQRAAWILTTHLQAGEFGFHGHEIRFGENCDLPPIIVETAAGDKICLEGRIDRVDLLSDPDCEYVKIMDYKSGDKNLDLSDIYHGLNLQLILYLAAVIRGLQEEYGKEIRPAGIFYFKIDDPMIEAKKDQFTAQEIEREINKKLKMTGLVLADTGIVRRMDRDMERSSAILPVEVKQDGEFGLRSAVLESEVFDRLIEYSLKKVGDIGAEILQGRIQIEPVKGNKISACSYCVYHPICQFDPVLDDNYYKNTVRLTKAEVIQKIAGQLQGGGQDA